MIYLSKFRLPTRTQEEKFLGSVGFQSRAVYTSCYPFRLFTWRDLPEFEFRDITVLYGGNGSGKSTILNVIAHRLELPRATDCNAGDFFPAYTKLSQYELNGDASDTWRYVSRILTSDDVFDRVLDIRRVNRGIDDRRAELVKEFANARREGADRNLHGMEDYERWREVVEANRTTSSQYIRKRLIRNVEERSNGETALAYFVDAIRDGGLYLLDEPENSLSPERQMDFRYFLEDCARTHGCQFILSTHSPLLLSLSCARIYDLDADPPAVRRWTELEGIRIYHRFFSEHEYEFD